MPTGRLGRTACPAMTPLDSGCAPHDERDFCPSLELFKSCKAASSSLATRRGPAGCWRRARARGRNHSRGAPSVMPHICSRRPSLLDRAPKIVSALGHEDARRRPGGLKGRRRIPRTNLTPDRARLWTAKAFAGRLSAGRSRPAARPETMALITPGNEEKLMNRLGYAIELIISQSRWLFYRS